MEASILSGFMLALWFGILTSISPCPLATNIAAISFISKKINTSKILLSGFLYTFGRMLAYIGVAVILVSAILSIPDISNALQKYMNKILGPLLILVGLILLEIIKINFKGFDAGEKFQKNIEKMGYLGTILLGIIFALSFCPVSAGLFFGSLIPIAVKYKSSILLPLIYGIGTALPVIIFSVFISISSQLVGKAFNKLTSIELWARKITGGIFILVGLYYCLVYIFKIL